MEVFDGHNDVLYSISNSDMDADSFYEGGELEITEQKAKRGRFVGGFFATYPPPESDDEETRQDLLEDEEVSMSPAITTQYAYETVKTQLSILQEINSMSERTEMVLRPEDLDGCVKNNKISIIPHVEGAEALGINLENLDELYHKGIRSIGITWSRPNAFGHGVPFKRPLSPDVGPGLSKRGKQLVERCDKGGIMVDLAHLNERGFWDVSEVYDGPLVSTHTAVHELAPSPRNLTDEQLREIQETDGVAGITFHVGDLREDGEVNSNTSISTLADHFEYIANEVGVRHVAFGSDFEGGTMPDELSDAGELQKLVEELRDRGFGKEELRKICHENWIRVLRETWQKS